MNIRVYVHMDLLFHRINYLISMNLRTRNAVCMWQWDICADTCAICRNSLNEPSIGKYVIKETVYFVT